MNKLLDRFWLSCPSNIACAFLAVVAALALAVAASISTGGHLSTDSIQQLYEAQIGASVSWNPPFMSALLQVLGASIESGAGISTALFVAIVCLCIWGAPLVVAFSSRAEKLAIVKLLLLAVLLLNPALIIYSGIVWKDVLLGAAAAVMAAAGLLSVSARSVRSKLLAIAVVAFLAGLLPLIRQQGWVIAPILLLLPILAITQISSRTGQRLAAIGILLLCTSAAYFSAKAWSESRVPGNDGRSISVGFDSIFRFDLTGIEAFSREGPLVRLGASPEALAELQMHYTPERIDFINRCPELSRFLDARGDAIPMDWFAAVREHPAAYLTHRVQVVAALFGFHRLGACLPLHLGVDGIERQILALGLERGADVIDRHLFQIALPLSESAFFKHATYLFLLLVLTGIVFFRRAGITKYALLVPLLAVFIFYASFLPTAIACDFRYLFSAIPMLNVIAVALAFSWPD